MRHRAPGARSPSRRDPGRGTGPPPAARSYLPAAVVPGLQQVVQEQATGWEETRAGSAPRGAARRAPRRCQGRTGRPGRSRQRGAQRAEPMAEQPEQKATGETGLQGHGGPREGPVVTVAVPHSLRSAQPRAWSRAMQERRPRSPARLCREPRCSHTAGSAGWAVGNRLLAGTARLATGFLRRAGVVHEHPCTREASSQPEVGARRL